MTQAEVQLNSMERAAIPQTQVTGREFSAAKAGFERIEREVVPDTDYNDNARAYLDSLARFRRARLDIDTAFGAASAARIAGAGVETRGEGAGADVGLATKVRRPRAARTSERAIRPRSSGP